MSEAPWLVVGLGNPGPRYATTRHNAGNLVVDVLADRMSASWSTPRGRRADVVEGHLGGLRVVLAKPASYMNESGPPVAGLLKYYKADLDHLIVVHDELDIDFGRIRCKRGGGHGGNNGVRDVAAKVGPDFLRVRVGIGRPPGRQDPADYVLEPWPARLREDVGAVLEAAADAVEALLVEPLETVQNRVHPA